MNNNIKLFKKNELKNKWPQIEKSLILKGEVVVSYNGKNVIIKSEPALKEIDKYFKNVKKK